MTLTVPHRRMFGWLICIATLFLFLLLTFRTQAQTTKSNTEKGKQTKTITPSQSDAKGRTVEMDGISRAELEMAQVD